MRDVNQLLLQRLDLAIELHDLGVRPLFLLLEEVRELLLLRLDLLLDLVLKKLFYLALHPLIKFAQEVGFVHVRHRDLLFDSSCFRL